MRRARTSLILGALLAALAVFVLITRGPAAPTHIPDDSFAFAAFGDSPYFPFESLQYRVVLEDIAAHDLAFALHVGDIMWARCTEARYRGTLEEFDALPHPVVYTPGDNEWTDCHEHDEDVAPLDRLATLRRVFFAQPSRSSGGRRIALEHQGASPEYAQFVENARWSHDGVVFATVHLVGSSNAREAFPGRTPADDSASSRRTAAAAAWLRDTFAHARATDAVALVVAFHANPGFGEPTYGQDRIAWEPFLTVLEGEAARYERPILLVHGDWHEFIVDHPLADPATGRPLAHVTRMQVPGSFDVGWVLVTVTPGAREPFAFEARVVPGWKYW